MKKLKIWQQGLLHGFFLWVFLEFNDYIRYWNQLQKSGPYIFNTDGSPVDQWDRFVNSQYYNGIFVPIFLLAITSEYSFQLFFRKRKYRTFLLSLVSGAILIELAFFAWQSATKEIPAEWSMARLLFFACASFIYALVKEFIQTQVNKKEHQIQQKDSEIRILKAQVNPHFFFNTLNTIYGTALEENAERTAKCIEQLSGIMRYTITGTGRDLTPLSEEMNFIADYLQLQRLRIPDQENIRIETDISIDDPSLKIAPLLLLPFIENAFKYGISTETPCKIDIQLHVTHKRLRFQVENTLLPKKNNPTGLGTGIENVKQLLELAYAGRYRLDYGAEGTDFKVVLHLNLD